MKKKLTLLLSTTLFLTACGVDYNSRINQTIDYPTETATEKYVYEDTSVSDKTNVSYAGYLNLETKDFKTDCKNLLSTVEELEGKVSGSQTNYREDYYTLDRLASVHMTVQVPQDKAIEFINRVEGDFTTSHSNLIEIDEGENRERLDAKIEMTKKKIKGYQEELNTDISDEDRIWIRQETSNLKDQLYHMELEYKSTEDRITYSNFDVDLNEVIRFAHEKPNLFESLKVSFRGFGEEVATILRATAGIAIGLVPIAFVLLLIVGIYKRITNYDQHIYLHHKDGTTRTVYMYGFKVHIICDAKYEFPVHFKVTPAGNPEGEIFRGKESGSYIEVDLENQIMFVYVNGELKVETDIVSGMAATEPATPTVPGAYQVWNMESPSVLVGENMQLGTEYSQPVNYWIPFDYTGQGIHDANWQPAFGGDNYLYSC